MVHMPDKKTSHRSAKNSEIPGYLKWRHLTSGQRDSRLPSSILFLIRVITLTDSVISFNTAKRLTNSLESVCKTVGHLCKQPVEEMHYRQILHIFGKIYTYESSQFKNKVNLIISKVEIENRLMHCEKKALDWVRSRYSEMDTTEIDSKMALEIDHLLKNDEEFKSTLLTDDAIPLLHADTNTTLPNIELTPISIPSKDVSGENEERPKITVTKKALSILDRIKQRAQERREQYIKMEQEKEKEVIKAAHAIFTLAITSNKKSFQKDFIEKKVAIFAHKTITIEDVLKHPLTKELIKIRETEDTKYLLVDLEKYKHTRFE
ncbi:hypothetical protein NEMIN01_1360 [Nematocida minor]|uniref:uncharacterized protein n=1 Tax=Nematocida minor TaxID=1912983 RepID=UPI00221FA242|nr:uncharacterized protein NEMIN01_1360 [Nematocida minor]KAI5191091.1 hypothetical protein NEMIN01_1360 [Nematocida minor]